MQNTWPPPSGNKTVSSRITSKQDRDCFLLPTTSSKTPGSQDFTFDISYSTTKQPSSVLIHHNDHYAEVWLHICLSYNTVKLIEYTTYYSFVQQGYSKYATDKWTCRCLNIFKNRLDKHWINQDVLNVWHAEISGTGSRSNIFSSVFYDITYLSLIFEMWA